MRDELVKYVANSLKGYEDYIVIALREMNEYRCDATDHHIIRGCIDDAIGDFILDNDIVGDKEEELWQMNYEDLFFDALELLPE